MWVKAYEHQTVRNKFQQIQNLNQKIPWWTKMHFSQDLMELKTCPWIRTRTGMWENPPLHQHCWKEDPAHVIHDVNIHGRKFVKKNLPGDSEFSLWVTAWQWIGWLGVSAASTWMFECKRAKLFLLSMNTWTVCAWICDVKLSFPVPAAPWESHCHRNKQVVFVAPARRVCTNQESGLECITCLRLLTRRIGDVQGCTTVHQLGLVIDKEKLLTIDKGPYQ